MINRIPGQRPESEASAAISPRIGEGEAALLPDDGSFAAIPKEPKIKNLPRATALLSYDQKVNLAIIAGRAFEKHKKAGLIEEGVKVDDWRHEEVRAATNGRASGLRDAMNREFKLIRGHFALLAGETGIAFQDAVNGAPEQADWELNWNLLKSNTEKKGYDFPSYPEVICRSQYKCALRDATAKQLFALVCRMRERKTAPQD